MLCCGKIEKSTRVLPTDYILRPTKAAGSGERATRLDYLEVPATKAHCDPHASGTTREATVKLYAFVVTALMVGWVVPAQAQDASNAGEDLGKKWVAAYDAGDAAAIAALFTPDGVFIPASGVVLKGREAIKNAIAARIKAGWNKETVNFIEGGAAGDAGWTIGDYAILGSGENEGKQIAGKYGETLVHDSDGWHIVMLVGNATPPKQ
jgi:uncharacterized protein (TIGR02246 family)